MVVVSIEDARKRAKKTKKQKPIEVEIDLHGFARNEGFEHLKKRLLTAKMQGAKTVYLITGRGENDRGFFKTHIEKWLKQIKIVDKWVWSNPGAMRVWLKGK